MTWRMHATSHPQYTGPTGRSDVTSEPFATISFNSKKLKKLEELYKEAVKAGRDLFFFEDHTILVSYAKYLIQYLKEQGL